ncbi:MAG: hypothetical protein RLZ76_695 [Bacteroidota bacterium]|jgi:hypothetical protein
MKYVLMFFTFLSVCNATDFLSIPLVLDDTREITIPAGSSSVDQTFSINVGNDADFQKYLNTIKSYDITGVTISAVSYSGPATTFNGTISFGSASAQFTNWDLKGGTEQVLPYTTAQLAEIGQKFQASGSENFTVKGNLSNSTGGVLKLHVKVNLKIKV